MKDDVRVGRISVGALLLFTLVLMMGAVAPALAGAADVDASLGLIVGGPVANPDYYQTYLEVNLTVPAPGVLVNDSVGVRATASTVADAVVPVLPSLIATLPTAPTNGSLKLNSDGSFSYTPNPGFVGTDSFTYCAQLSLPLGGATAELGGAGAAGSIGVSPPAKVTITVLPAVVDRPITKFIVSRRRSFEVYGFMLPAQPEGSYPVTLYCYRWERRRWVLRQMEPMRAYNWPHPTKYGNWIRLRKSGRWALVAVHQSPGGTFTYSDRRILYVR